MHKPLEVYTIKSKLLKLTYDEHPVPGAILDTCMNSGHMTIRHEHSSSAFLEKPCFSMKRQNFSRLIHSQHSTYGIPKKQDYSLKT